MEEKITMAEGLDQEEVTLLALFMHSTLSEDRLGKEHADQLVRTLVMFEALCLWNQSDTTSDENQSGPSSVSPDVRIASEGKHRKQVLFEG